MSFLSSASLFAAITSVSMANTYPSWESVTHFIIPANPMTFDLQYIGSDDIESFSIPIKDPYDHDQAIWMKVHFDFINGQCEDPHFTVNANFGQYGEFIDIFFPDPIQNDHLTECAATKSSDCNHWQNCIQDYSLKQNATDSVVIYLLRSGSMDKKCLPSSSYSTNAEVVVRCGKADEIFTKQIHSIPDNSSFTIPVQSDIQLTEPTIFEIHFDFINHPCHDPKLSVLLEADYDEYYVYYPTYPENIYNALVKCSYYMDECGVFSKCVDNAAIGWKTLNFHSFTIYIRKSSDNKCSFSVNMIVTISCGITTTSIPTKQPTMSPTTTTYNIWTTKSSTNTTADSTTQSIEMLSTSYTENTSSDSQRNENNKSLQSLYIMVVASIFIVCAACIVVFTYLNKRNKKNMNHVRLKENLEDHTKHPIELAEIQKESETETKTVGLAMNILDNFK